VIATTTFVLCLVKLNVRLTSLLFFLTPEHHVHQVWPYVPYVNLVIILRNLNFFCTDIDFGRFLGNAEKFAGVSRDRAPFVFTPEFAYVMGGVGSAEYKSFVELCCAGYNVLRRNASIFISLFAMVRFPSQTKYFSQASPFVFRCFPLVFLNCDQRKT